MITASKKNMIQRSGVVTENTFQIKANGKAFRILSDGLYSDKIRAVIRELSCNAYDAHVDGKNLDTPFHIQLPNKLDPTFKIRDFGIGLSAHDVAHVYTTYFESTKTESNDFVGCLGLGSKSPFAYTDSFSVVSYFNGKKYMFNAFLNESETPTIALLAEIDTDEHNGIEVSFPVKADDFYEFSNKSASVFRHFKLRPEITGADVTIPEVKYFMEGKGWGLREDKVAGAVAIMGNVSYPMRGINSDLSDTQRQLINNVPIDIDFDIGSLEVSASRESLSYNKSTLDSIKARLDIIAIEIETNVISKISNAASLWEARIMAYKLVQGEYSTVKGLLGKSPFEWGGEPLSIGYVKNNIEGMSINRFTFATSYRRRRSYSNSTRTRAISRDMTDTIQCTDEVAFYWNDLNTGSHVRCKQVLLNDNKDESDNDILKSIYLISGTPEMIKDLQELLGLPEAIKPVSSIIRIKVARASNSDVNPLNSSRLLVYDDTDSEHDVASSYWRKEKLRVKNGGVYVVIDRYKINESMPNRYISSMANVMNTIGEDLEETEIIGAKSRIVDDKLCDMDNWIPLHEFVKAKVVQFFKDNDMAKRIALRKEVCDLTANTEFNLFKVLFEETDLSKDSIIAELLNTLEDMKLEIGESVDKYLSLSDNYGYGKEVEAEGTIGLGDTWATIKSRYPLMLAIDSSYLINRNKEAIRDYIRMKDMDLLLTGEEEIKEIA